MEISTFGINAVDKTLMGMASMGRRRTLTTKAPAASTICRSGISVCMDTKYLEHLKG